MNIKRWHLNLWIQQCSSQSPVPLASLLLADSEPCLRVLVGTRHEVATQSSPCLSLQLRHPLPEKKTPRRCPAFAAARHGCQCPCPRALSSVTPKLSVLGKPNSHGGMSGSPNPGTTQWSSPSSRSLYGQSVPRIPLWNQFCHCWLWPAAPPRQLADLAGNTDQTVS